jgi:hypothetical protein
MNTFESFRIIFLSLNRKTITPFTCAIYPSCFLLCCSAIASCSKTEDVTIKDNVPPPDGTIDSTTIDIYINKCYINILGREPVGNEKSSAKTILSQNNFSVADRKQFLQTFYTTNEYKRNQYNVARNDYLRNVDSVEVYYQKLIFENLITQPQYAPFYDLLSGEIARLNLLLSINNDMADRHARLQRDAEALLV